MTMDNKTNKDMTMDNKTNKGMDKTMTMTMEGTGKRYIQFCAWSSSSIGNGIYGFHGLAWSCMLMDGAATCQKAINRC